jgi:NAD+ kinase
MKKVGIYIHPQWAAARSFADDLRAALQSRVEKVWQAAAWDEEAGRANLEGTELLVCIGGDGTVLWAARSVVPHPVPLLAINMGRLGFLADLRAEEALAKLNTVLEGDFRIEERTMVQAELLGPDDAGGEGGQTFHALNDVVLGRGAPGRPVYIETCVDGRRFSLYRADAMIVATATGSTGYALSVGGPILHPEATDLVVASVAPHLAAARALVLPAGAVVELRLMAEPDGVLSIDGQVDVGVAHGQRLRIQRSPYVARFVRLGSLFDYYEALSERLGWLNALGARWRGYGSREPGEDDSLPSAGQR